MDGATDEFADERRGADQRVGHLHQGAEKGKEGEAERSIGSGIRVWWWKVCNT
jgi:hypothetical protein